MLSMLQPIRKLSAATSLQIQHGRCAASESGGRRIATWSGIDCTAPCRAFYTDLLKCSVVREHRADFLVRDNGHFLFQLDWRCSLGDVNWRNASRYDKVNMLSFYRWRLVGHLT